MKITTRILFACLILISSLSILKSQDTLFMKNGAKIPTKILEITPTEVKYKKTDNPDGPTFTTLGSDINLIKYANGTIDSIKVEPPVVAEKKAEKVSAPRPPDPHPAIYPSGPFFKYDGRHIKSKDAQSIMLKVNDPEINRYVKATKVSKAVGLVGFLAIPTFLFGAGYSIYAFANNEGGLSSEKLSYGPGIASGVVAVASLGTAITFNVRKKHSMKKALNIYNEKY